MRELHFVTNKNPKIELPKLTREQEVELRRQWTHEDILGDVEFRLYDERQKVVLGDSLKEKVMDWCKANRDRLREIWADACDDDKTYNQVLDIVIAKVKAELLKGVSK